MQPDYKKIYSDLISEKFPLKLKDYQDFLNKKKLNCLDVIQINNLLFPNRELENSSQKHKSYDQESILQILRYQREKELNNSQLARYFKLSRNTVALWKDKYKL